MKALIGQLLLTNPNEFMQALMSQSDWFSFETAKKLDDIDPLNHTSSMFNIAELIPFAGHSLGPVFQPALDKIRETAILQLRLHDGHFPDFHPEGKVSGNWFDCDRYKPGLCAAKSLLGFDDDCEFIFTASGLSQNLGMLMDTFYRPSKQDWDTGRTKIIMLDNEFFSDQAVAISVLKRAIQNADQFDCFNSGNKPDPEELIVKIKSNDKGIFNTEEIIDVIKDNAKQIQMIFLSDIVFNTGQRIEISKIFSTLEDAIKKHQIIVGLDLAHTAGNRVINLEALKVTFAVSCGYKYLSGFAGSTFGIYVNKNANLKKYPPLQGWKAADSNCIFSTINRYDASIMAKTGADAFRMSCPSPVALIPTQTFLIYFDKIGFDKCFNKSECLTRYLLAQLKYYLDDKIELITPEDPTQRGAMIVFQIKNFPHVENMENFLKNEQSDLGNYEIDFRPPNNIRVSAHYAYTKFEHINRLVNKLLLAINRSP